MRCDVLVVGGGLAGACVAWQLRGRGLSVVVAEAGRAGRGTDDAPSGTRGPSRPRRSKMVMSIPEADAHAALDALGPQALADVIDLSARGRAELVLAARALAPELVQAHGSLAVASAEDHEDFLAEVAAYAAAGRPARRDGALQAALAAFPGAALVDAFALPDDAAVDGEALCRRLLEASGAVLLEGRRVLALDEEAGAIRARARDGDIVAGEVVLATNAATGHPALARLLVPMRTFALVYEAPGPDSPNLYTLGGRSLDLLRSDGLLRACGEDLREDAGPDAVEAAARSLDARLRELWPGLPAGGPVERLLGRYAVTPDELPAIGRLGPRLTCMVGCNAIAHATWSAGAALVPALLGLRAPSDQERRWLALLDPLRAAR